MAQSSITAKISTIQAAKPTNQERVVATFRLIFTLTITSSLGTKHPTKNWQKMRPRTQQAKRLAKRKALIQRTNVNSRSKEIQQKDLFVTKENIVT
jgi:hypothetical protein